MTETLILQDQYLYDPESKTRDGQFHAYLFVDRFRQYARSTWSRKDVIELTAPTQEKLDEKIVEFVERPDVCFPAGVA